MPKTESPIDFTKKDPDLDIVKCMAVARKECGKGLFAQVSEIAALAMGPGKLKPRDYYYYGLYDESRFTPQARRAFVGKRIQDKIHLQCSARDWWAIAHDKLVCYALLAGLGAPIPKTIALYHARRGFANVPVLRSADALAAQLRGGMAYPFFSKPVTGMWSTGSVLAESFDAASDRLVLPHGETAPVEAFVDAIAGYELDGYLFQEPLRPHPTIRGICGDRLSTARVVVMLGRDETEILHAIWKIPVGRNVADNFWRAGNMLGLVDVESGRVTRVVRGVGPDHREVEAHPDTGAPVKGAVLPDWEALKSLCLEIGATLTGLRLQAWDIAMCQDGPVAMEVNIGGEFNLPQLATGSGLLSARFRRFLDGIDRAA